MKIRDQTYTLEKGPRDLTRLFRVLSALDTSKRWRIVWGLAKRERSNLQNRALWGVAYKVLSEATGNDPEDLHTYFCGEFFSWIEYEVMDQKRRRPFRTTTTDEDGKRDVISTIQLKEMYEFIQRRAAETVGVDVPDPDPEWWSKRGEQHDD